MTLKNGSDPSHREYSIDKPPKVIPMLALMATRVPPAEMLLVNTPELKKGVVDVSCMDAGSRSEQCIVFSGEIDVLK
jgi:hypothetical protein